MDGSKALEQRAPAATSGRGRKIVAKVPFTYARIGETGSGYSRRRPPAPAPAAAPAAPKRKRPRVAPPAAREAAPPTAAALWRLGDTCAVARFEAAHGAVARGSWLVVETVALPEAAAAAFADAAAYDACTTTTVVSCHARFAAAAAACAARRDGDARFARGAAGPPFAARAGLERVALAVVAAAELRASRS